MRAFSIVCSSSAKWHWASSWLEDGENLPRRGEEEREVRERGREGREMDIGELMLNLLGGEDEGLMLSEEPRRDRRLLPLSLSSTFSLGMLIQEIFSGMLRCLTGGAERRGTELGRGGRGGGDRDTVSFWLQLAWLLSPCSSVFLMRLCSSLWPDWLPWLWFELQTWGLLPQQGWVSWLVSPLLLIGSSLRTCFAVPEAVALESPSGWWTFRKRGLMKHSAPLDWQHSSSDGLRVWSCGRPGGAAKETGPWVVEGGLLGAPSSDNKTFLLWHNWAAQKPGWDSEKNTVDDKQHTSVKFYIFGCELRPSLSFNKPGPKIWWMPLTSSLTK